MQIDNTAIFTGLILATVTGAASFVIGVLAKAWPTFWVETAEGKRSRTIFFIAIAALFLSFSGLVVLAVRPASVSFEVQRFGDIGPAGNQPGDEGDYTSQNVDKEKGREVARLKEYPICTVSHVTLSKIVNDDMQQCALLQVGDYWIIHVLGVMRCRVTCFKPVP